MKLSSLTISITVFLIVLGLLLVPVGLKNYNDNLKNTKYQNTYTVINNTLTWIAPDTQLKTIKNYANTNTTYKLYYKSNLVGIYTQSINTNTMRTTDGGNIYLNFTDIQVTQSTLRVLYSDIYGLSDYGKTIINSVTPLLFAIIIISLIYTFRLIK